MFRDSSAHLQEDIVIYMQDMVLSSWWPLGTQLTLCTERPLRTLIESDSTISCRYATISSWRWALESRNM